MRPGRNSQEKQLYSLGQHPGSSSRDIKNNIFEVSGRNLTRWEKLPIMVKAGMLSTST